MQNGFRHKKAARVGCCNRIADLRQHVVEDRHGGEVLILRDGKTYTIQGQEVR